MQPICLLNADGGQTPQVIAKLYGHLIHAGRILPVERFNAPGLCALNFVVGDSMDGGVLASTSLDPVAKGMAQLLLDFPIPVRAGLLD